jgi:filamentous hemagglutinin
LGAVTYQNASALYSKLSGYVNDLADFSGASYGGVSISEVASRTLTVAVPNAGTAAQQQVIQQIIQVGIQRGVTVNVVVFP